MMVKAKVIQQPHNAKHDVDSMMIGCAFLLFKDVPSAITAITTLNGKLKLEGSSANMVVQFAAADKSKQQPNQPQLQPPAMPMANPMMGGMFAMPQHQSYLDPYVGLSNAAAAAAGNPMTAYGAANYMLPGGKSLYMYV